MANSLDMQTLESLGFRWESNSPTGYVIGGDPKLGTGTPVMPDGRPWTGQSMLGVATDPQKATQLLQQIQQEYINQSLTPGVGVGGAQAEKVNALQNEFSSLFPDRNVSYGILNAGYKEQQTAIEKYLEEQQAANEAMKNVGSGLSIGNILKTFGDLTVKVGPAIAGVALAAHGIPALLSSIAPAAGAAGGAAAGSGLSAAELLAVGGFTPTAGSAASFAAPSLLGGAAGAGGSLPSFVTAAAKGGLLGAGVGGASSALQGKNILEGALIGGATGLVGGGAGEVFGGGLYGNIAGGALSGGAGSLLRGTNPLQGALIGGASGALLSGINELTSVGNESIALPSETPYIDLPDGEFLLSNAGVGSSLMGPTYQELGVTGVEGGLAGPTYKELGYTGLNNAEAIAAADAAAKAVAGSSLLDSKLLSQGLKIGGSLLGGGSQPQQPTQQAARPQSIIPRGQVDYSGILNLLQARSPQRNMYSLLG